MAKIEKMMPNNYDAEQSLLGAIMIDNEVAFDVLGDVIKTDFYFEPHQHVYNAMLTLHSISMPIDIITLSDRLEKENLLAKVGGISYLTELTNVLPSSANFKYYADIIKRDGMLRRLISSGSKIIENSYRSDDSVHALNYAEKLIFDISQEKEQSSLVHIKESSNLVIKKFEGILKDRDSNKGLMTGFYNLDNITNGFLPSQMIVLAARPGCGKTSYAMNIVANICQKTPEKKIAVFNLEMSSTELTQRLICNIAEVSMGKVLRGEESEEEFSRLWHAKAKLDESNIYIDDSALITPEEILSKCRRIARQCGGLDFVVIDYLQLISSSRTVVNKQQEVSEISRSMKILAKELGVPVMILSQMSRAIEKRDVGDRTPKLSDLRESGAIEQDADMVFFLDKKDASAADEESDEKFIDLIMAKHRNGPCETVHYLWNGECVKFTPVSKNKVMASIKKADSSADGSKDKSDKQPKNSNTASAIASNQKQADNVADQAVASYAQVASDDIGNTYVPENFSAYDEEGGDNAPDPSEVGAVGAEDIDSFFMEIEETKNVPIVAPKSFDE